MTSREERLRERRRAAYRRTVAHSPVKRRCSRCGSTDHLANRCQSKATRTRVCRACGKRKRLASFHRHTRFGTQYNCKRCANKIAKAWRKRNPSYGKARWSANRPYFRNHRLLERYGISLDDYNRMYARQRRRCAICRRPERRRLRGRIAPLVVDHDHVTGRVRGLLCHRCNTALGYVEQRLWLRKAQAYLRRAP